MNHPTCSYKDRVVSIAATRADRARVHGLLLRLDGQPRGQRRLARRAPRPLLLRLHPRRSRSRQSRRRQHLSPAHHRGARELRRCESAVHAGGGQVQVGIRQHQPARVLRGGRQDLRLRDCRAARLEVPAARRVAGRRRHAPAAHPQGLRRAADRRARRGRAAVHPCRAGGWLRAGRPRARGRHGVSRSGQAEHDRQVDRDRQSGRRIPGAALACGRPAAPARW